MKKRTITALILTACLMAGCSGKTPAVSDTSASEVTTTVETTTEETEPEGDLNPEFEDLWSRTNVDCSLWAQINISDVNGNSMHVTGTFQYYYHLGDIDADAYFISENEAVISQQDLDPAADPGFIYLTLNGDTLTITSADWFWGMGEGVTVDGEFTNGNPVYNNATILEDTFSEDELTDIQEIIDDDNTYENSFKTPTIIGIVTDEEVLLTNGTSARHISCTVPTDTAGYDMLITANGKIYLDVNDGEIYTNDSAFTGEELPDFVVE